MLKMQMVMMSLFGHKKLTVTMLVQVLKLVQFVVTKKQLQQVH